MDLHVIPFENVYNLGDPNVALSHWIDLFFDVINKHAPLKRRKRKEKRKKREKEGDNKKSTGCDGISVKLLKIALLYIAETLTYIYNLCIQKNVFPTAFKRAKVIPLPKTKLSPPIWTITALSRSCLFSQSHYNRKTHS